MIDLPIPHITAREDSARLSQVVAYLRTLAFSLRDTLESIGVQAGGGESERTHVSAEAKRNPRADFAAIKQLIVSSAEVIEAVCEESERRLSGRFAASSDYGVFTESTERRILESEKRTDSLFESMQTLTSAVTGLENEVLQVSARMRAGLLYYDGEGYPVYGLEIGQTNRENGKEVFQKYARFTPDRLSFYDRNGVEVAYIGDYMLHISAAEIAGDLKIGGYRVETTAGLAFKWEGDATWQNE